MIVVGSSKLISNRELFHIIILLHQGSVFWVLPYFIVKDNGTAGLLALLPGLLTGVLTIIICSFWHSHCGEIGFIEALPQMLSKPLGKLLGLLLVLFYMAFTVVCLCSFVEMMKGQLLVETPRLVLLCTIFLLVGWFSWNGLEDIARIAVLCTLIVAVLLLLVTVGNLDVFSVRELFPLQVKNSALLQQATVHSIYSYGGLMALFMIYPALNREKIKNWQSGLALLLSTGILAAGLILSLGVFGQAGQGPAIWLPLELARMVRLGPFLERTEALFTMLWILIVFVNGSVLVWCASEGLHQLVRRPKSVWLHWGLVAILLVASVLVKDVLQLFQLEQLLSQCNLYFLPLILLLIGIGTILYSRRKEGQRS